MNREEVWSEVAVARETAKQITGQRIEECEVVVPTFTRASGETVEHDRVSLIRLKVEGVGWVDIDPWASYADDTGVVFEVQS